MNIRKATKKDVKRLSSMLSEVQALHANGREDIFNKGVNKYTDTEIENILSCDKTPVFVTVDENDIAIAYAFCEIEDFSGTHNLKKRKVFMIDDLCVDSAYRGKGLGSELYKYVLGVAKEMGCYHLTLNVWHLNKNAIKFYEKMGMNPLKTIMEQIL